MSGSLPPDHTQIPKTVSDVADNLNRARVVGGLWRKFGDGQKQRGEAYMDGSRILIQQTRGLMDDDDRDHVDAAYNALRDAREKLVATNESGFRGLREARKFKRLSKDTWKIVKVTSDRALDDKIVGPLDGTGTPARSPPATPAESDRPLLHNPFTDPVSHAATSSKSVWMQDTKMTTLSPGAAGIGDPMGDVSETYSFIHPDPNFASSWTSIASYKTERTVNSRKSRCRYNARLRHKYEADCDPSHFWVPQDLTTLKIDDASVLETESMNVSPSSTLCDQPIYSELESVLESRPGPSPGTHTLDRPRAAQPATEHAHRNTQSQTHIKALPPGPSSDQWTTGRAQGGKSVVNLCDVDIFGSDSESGEDDRQRWE